LLREHRLGTAAAEAEEGTQLAQRHRDLRTMAHGKRCQAEIFLHMAQEGVGHDRDYYLRKSVFLLSAATAMVHTLCGATSEEVGECALLRAELTLLRYSLSGDRADLATAGHQARTAEILLSPRPSRTADSPCCRLVFAWPHASSRRAERR
jgi:hypothetical protein